MQRAFDAGGSSRSEPSVGTRHVAWYCGALASDDALLWFDLSTNPRQLVLYRPQ